MLEFLIDKIFNVFSGMFFLATDSRHLMGINCDPLLANCVRLFVGGRLYTGPSQGKRKEASPILKFHVQLYG